MKFYTLSIKSNVLNQGNLKIINTILKFNEYNIFLFNVQCIHKIINRIERYSKGIMAKTFLKGLERYRHFIQFNNHVGRKGPFEFE